MVKLSNSYFLKKSADFSWCPQHHHQQQQEAASITRPERKTGQGGWGRRKREEEGDGRTVLEREREWGPKKIGCAAGSEL